MTVRILALRPLGLAASVALAGLSGGCVFWAPSLDPLRHELEAAVPRAHVDPGIQLRLGRLSLGLARSIVRAGAEDEEERQVADLLRHVKGVEVAVYEVEPLEPHEMARWRRQLDSIGERRGWQVAARFEDEGQVGSVLYQIRGGEIRSVYVFALDEESLVLARFKGHLDRAIADAIALKGRELPQALVAETGTGR
jgi:hypothetical protein